VRGAASATQRGGVARISGEIDIQATPAQILDVLADLPGYPRWSVVHKSARVEASYPDGRPKRAAMTVSAMGLVDEQVIDYTWGPDGLRWTLVRSRQQRGQDGSYLITGDGDGCSHVRYDLDIRPMIPLPGIIVREVMRTAVRAATYGLRDRVESSA
jgi:hypothetical protein